MELVRDLRTMNVLAKFQNNARKITDVRVLIGFVCPDARLSDDSTPEPWRAAGKKQKSWQFCALNNYRSFSLFTLIVKPSKAMAQKSYLVRKCLAMVYDYENNRG